MRFDRKVLFSILVMLVLSVSFGSLSYINVRAVDQNSSVPSSSQTSSIPSSTPSSSSVPSSSVPSSSNVTPPASSYTPPASYSSAPARTYSAPAVSSSSKAAVVVSSEEVSSSSEPEESEISLPEVSEDDISLPYVLASAGSSAENNKLLGIIAWSCIGLGVLIVLIVLFSGKRAQKGYVARKRYKSSFGLGKKKKRLLSDSYYRNIRRK